MAFQREKRERRQLSGGPFVSIVENSESWELDSIFMGTKSVVSEPRTFQIDHEKGNF